MRLELTTFSLARRRSTNWTTPASATSLCSVADVAEILTYLFSNVKQNPACFGNGFARFSSTCCAPMISLIRHSLITCWQYQSLNKLLAACSDNGWRRINLDNTQKFSGKAEVYRQSRLSYSPIMFVCLRDQFGVTPGWSGSVVRSVCDRWCDYRSAGNGVVF